MIGKHFSIIKAHIFFRGGGLTKNAYIANVVRGIGGLMAKFIRKRFEFEFLPK